MSLCSSCGEKNQIGTKLDNTCGSALTDESVVGWQALSCIRFALSLCLFYEVTSLVVVVSR